MKIAKMNKNIQDTLPLCVTRSGTIFLFIFRNITYSMSEFRKQRHSLINMNIIYIYLIFGK